MVASNKYSQNSQFFDHILEHCVSSPWVLWPNKHASPVQLSFYFQVFSIGVKFHPWHKQTVDYWGCFLHQKFHPSKKFCHPYSEPPNSDPRLWGDICAWKFSNVMILKMILKSTENYTFLLIQKKDLVIFEPDLYCVKISFVLHRITITTYDNYCIVYYHHRSMRYTNRQSRNCFPCNIRI